MSTGWNLVPQKPVDLDIVPIDALRGLHYFLVERADKKLSKIELKRTLKVMLKNKDEQDKLVQHIVDIVFSPDAP
ncbi:MAG: hypothetical protein Q6373_017890 [Candidatus Sigynarchaeota archaeon]